MLGMLGFTMALLLQGVVMIAVFRFIKTDTKVQHFLSFFFVLVLADIPWAYTAIVLSEVISPTEYNTKYNIVPQLGERKMQEEIKNLSNKKVYYRLVPVTEPVLEKDH